MREVLQVMRLITPLLSKAGFPIEDWSTSVLSRRNDRAKHRIVVKLSAPGRVTLAAKLILRPHEPANFEKSMLRQVEMAESMPCCPKIYGFDAASQVVLMDFMEGQNSYDIFYASPAEHHEQALTTAGRWVDKFHRSAHWELRQFKPVYTLNHLAKLRKSINDGEVEVPRKSSFLTALEQTIQTAPEPHQCQTIAAVNHGDLNLRNILLHGETASGLDFGSPRLLPVAHDLARLFCHYGALCVKPNLIDYQPLSGVNLDPFFKGYKLVAKEDQTVAFLCRVRLLRDWQTIPRGVSQQNIAQMRRFRGIQALARRMFV